MKKLVLTAATALLLSSSLATAADLDREIGLIVSGVVDKWAGVQFIDDGVNDEALFANGGEGRLSLPLGSNLSIQTDVKYEYNSNALESFASNDVAGPRFGYLGATHLSYRDPSSFLLGVLGGAGRSNSAGSDYDFGFVGGEAQVYLNDLTLYAQGGFVDFDNRNALSPVDLDEGLFARGVLRWFLSNNSRLQLEGTYYNFDFQSATGEFEAFAVGARYDFNVALPVVGQMPLFVGYRGTFRDTCYDVQGAPLDIDDHVFMVGTSYSFSGDMLTVDRQGATLDTPNFNHGCVGSTAAISDRRLKTDSVALGSDAAGNMIYSWKYKSDPVTTWVGVMAQDLVYTHPEALVVDANGFFAVRYDLIGAQMMTLEQWNSRAL